MKIIVLSTLLVVQLAAAAVVPSLVNPVVNCEPETLTGDGGTFTSPNFPEDYGSNSNCSWLIITGSGTVIQLRFESFLLESNGDFAQVYDGPTTASSLLQNHTGFTIPQPVTSSSNVMLVLLETNAQLNYAGFQARYLSYIPTTTPATATPPNPNNCGGVEVGNGIIQTPNHPSDYPNNANCIWYLQGNAASAIILEFRAFDTENKLDFVSVWEGWNPTGSDPLATYSGSNLTVPFAYATTNTNRLTVKFESDDSVSSSGFLAYFS